MNKYRYELTFWDGPIAYFIGRYRWKWIARVKKRLMSLPQEDFTITKLRNPK